MSKKTVHRYVLDTEFVEGFTHPWFSKSKHFIDLISIGIVTVDRVRGYQSVCSDFDVKRAYYAHDLKLVDKYNQGGRMVKDFWVRDHVLHPIFRDFYPPNLANLHHDPDFSLGKMRDVVRRMGRSAANIKDDLIDFLFQPAIKEYGNEAWSFEQCCRQWLEFNEIRIYVDYGHYDYVKFVSLFGRMVDLPPGIPMFARELQQIMAENGLNEGDLMEKGAPTYAEHTAMGDARSQAYLLRRLLEREELNKLDL